MGSPAFRSTMHLLDFALRRTFVIHRQYGRLLAKSSSSTFDSSKRFFGTSQPTSEKPSTSSGPSPSTNRQTSSFAADTSISDSNRKAILGGIPKQWKSTDRMKQTYYFQNRSVLLRLRHWFMRRSHALFSAIRRYKLILLFLTLIAVQFFGFHSKYRLHYGFDYPITNFDWLRRKYSGTLDPELARRGHQADRYIKRRIEEEVKE